MCLPVVISVHTTEYQCRNIESLHFQYESSSVLWPLSSAEWGISVFFSSRYKYLQLLHNGNAPKASFECMLSLSAMNWETITDLTMQVQSVSICTISNATTYRNCLCFDLSVYLIFLSRSLMRCHRQREEMYGAKIDFNIWKNLDL